VTAPAAAPAPTPPAARTATSRSAIYSTAGGFFLLGAALSAAISVIYRSRLPPAERGESTLWNTAFACAAAAGALGFVLLIVRHRLAERYATALPFLAIGLIALPILWSRTMTPSGAILMIWPVLFASCLLTEPITWATTGSSVLVLIAASALDPHRSVTRYCPMAATLILTGYVVVTLQRRVRDLVTELARQASTDPLTGLANRRTLLDTLTRETARQRRRAGALSLLMIDIDRFKRLNDSAGHDAGDEALRRLAALLRRETRAGDLTARFGGEEFTALLIDCPRAEAAVRAEELRARIEQDSRTWPRAITVSVGVAELSHDPPQGVSALITNADDALYVAKRSGRNRIAVHEQEPG
jgi:diguanylate cyclase (GGDEF)-like protein